jgi:hypothetical protein
MGQDVAARVFSRADRQRYREKVRVCLDVFARMLAESRFEPARGSFGLEIELNLRGNFKSSWTPSTRAVLGRLDAGHLESARGTHSTSGTLKPWSTLGR